ncbi:carboxypeptidase-like regulatory domain-containing protein [Chitinophaga sp. S165]|uniref:carboxypeptidase-like regulatory domain-containing protein n=1 Tax=Chitinophaga sp. S165 TaxID=2135462 RepID=UPI000D7163FF|nr:carboxypeptidase-like regulatory domain-containing protein [Chitinophaga sp. S165]PWV48153.1 hypothetical protein C7475_10759 [Chitinophaga sp. S165]
MKQLLLVLYCSLCLVACVDWDVTGPAGPEGPPGPPGQKPPGTDTSTIYGRVFTFNEFTFPIWPVDSAKITLHLSPDSTLETMADTSGFYQFNGISTGTYNITFSRDRFGTMKVFGLTHLSGGTLGSPVPDVAIGQIPVQTALDSAWIINAAGDYFQFAFRYRTPVPEFPQHSGNFELYFSRNANVSPTNYLLRSTSLSVLKSALRGYFAPGDSMYVKIYTAPKYFIREVVFFNGMILWFDQERPGLYYTDPATGSIVYPFRSAEGALVSTIYNG